MKYYSVMRGLWYTITRFPIAGVMTQTQAMPCYKGNPFKLAYILGSTLISFQKMSPM